MCDEYLYGCHVQWRLLVQSQHACKVIKHCTRILLHSPETYAVRIYSNRTSCIALLCGPPRSLSTVAITAAGIQAFVAVTTTAVHCSLHARRDVVPVECSESSSYLPCCFLSWSSGRRRCCLVLLARTPRSQLSRPKDTARSHPIRKAIHTTLRKLPATFRRQERGSPPRNGTPCMLPC